MDRYFAAGGGVDAPQRTQLAMGDGVLLTMPATGRLGAGDRAAAHDDGPGPGTDRVVGGVKVVTVRAANAEIGAPTVQAVYLLFGSKTLSPLAVIDGPALTNLRTSAVSAVATARLARAESSTLVLFGAGAQARAHLRAMAAIRPIRQVIVVSRTRSRAQELVALAASMGLEARLGVAADVAHADIVCCCSTSAEPLFDGGLLRPGTHVVAVGAYRPDLRELDETTMRRGWVVVEERASATSEAGELAQPAAAGRPIPIGSDLIELCSSAERRVVDSDITVFKSVGMAGEDLVIADALYQAVVYQEVTTT